MLTEATVKLVFALCLLAAQVIGPVAAEEVTYNRDVRPILSDKCFACHGPDDEQRSAGLRLDIRQQAIDAEAFRPGDADASVLVDRIETENPDLVMPPPETNKPLSDQEKRTLRRWIADGATYQRHWAWEPIEAVALPQLADSTWCRNPIDDFILRRLVDRGLTPSPPADRYTLIRRVYLDLVGLLPSPAQVDAFVHDDSPDAYTRLVDSLLASPHYGERWGRHWLDQARYADSNGYTIDSPRVMWPYRDWVIHALNGDMPFDQFTIEQLAGDLLPEPTKDQLTATGFHRNTLINEEGGTDDEQFRVESVIDRTNTTGEVWLALTVGCAQCHNHKFDPISQRDYYKLYAFFNSTQDKNNVGPQVLLHNPHADRIGQIKAELAEIKKSLGQQQNERRSIDWQVVRPVEQRADSGAEFERLDDSSLLVSGTRRREDAYHVDYEIGPQTVAALRLDVLPHEWLPNGGPGRADNGNFVLTDVSLSDASGQPIELNSTASSDYSQDGFPVTAAVDSDPHSGWAINTRAKGNVAHWAQFTLTDPSKVETASTLRLTLRFWHRQRPYTIGRFRLSVSSRVPPDDQPDKLAAQRLEKEKKRLESKQVKTMVMRELAQQRPTHVLVRGDFLRPGEEVTRGVLTHLHPMNAGDGSPTRLDLARWLIDSGNPVTPRVVVNRVWQNYFGKGIVETVGDFGSQGSSPSHPDLLDWLSSQLVSSGWSLKRLHRWILTSSVYQQASRSRPELDQADPLNQLLGRQNRLRVDAEIVRDLALSASGRVAGRIGGPPVYPPQPAGVYAFTQKKKNWPISDGEDRYRRTMYTFFYRSAPHPMLTTFDTPRFNVSCTRRARSNTPLQSLMVANDPGMYELAESLAKRVLSEKSETAERIALAFRLCMCRPPTSDEKSFLGEFLCEQKRKFAVQTDGGSAVDPLPSAWIAMTRVLMNLDEFITRE